MKLALPVIYEGSSIVGPLACWIPVNETGALCMSRHISAALSSSLVLQVCPFSGEQSSLVGVLSSTYIVEKLLVARAFATNNCELR